MKLCIWHDPYTVPYGTSLVFAVAEDWEAAREKAMAAPDARKDVTLGYPDKILELPSAAATGPFGGLD